MGLEKFWIGKIEINEYTMVILAIVAFAIVAGFRYRRNLYLEDLRIPALCDRKVAGIIGWVIGLTLLWNGLLPNIFGDLTWPTTIVITCMFIFWSFAEEHEGEIIDNILPVVNGFLLPVLSFQPSPNNIIFAVATVLISLIILRVRKNEELVSNFVETAICCLESIVFSLIIDALGWNGAIFTTLFVIFCETVLFSINYYVKNYVEDFLN